MLNGFAALLKCLSPPAVCDVRPKNKLHEFLFLALIGAVFAAYQLLPPTKETSA